MEDELGCVLASLAGGLPQSAWLPVPVGVTAMARRQVNILLTQEERDLVEAVAFVEETTASELLRPAVAAYLNKQRNDADVTTALSALKNRQARKEGKLADLRQRIASEASDDT